MKANQKGQGSKQQDDAGASKQSGNPGSGSSARPQGGTHEQHVDAGRQSHKNDQDQQPGVGNRSGKRDDKR